MKFVDRNTRSKIHLQENAGILSIDSQDRTRQILEVVYVYDTFGVRFIPGFSGLKDEQDFD